MDVKVGFYFQSIDEIKAESGTLIVNLWRRMSWIDVMLGWRPEEFDGISQTIMDPEKVWTPGKKYIELCQILILWS